MKMYEKSISIINNKIDMINYLKFFDEHINIKCLLFNDVQSLCFSFTEKPKLYDKKKYKYLLNSDHESIKEIVDYFIKKKLLISKSSDNRIFDLLNKNIKDLITKNK